MTTTSTSGTSMPPMDRNKPAGSGGAGGMITALLALMCVGLAITCITLYSGRASLKDENARMAEDKAHAEADAKNKSDLLTQANDRVNKMSVQLQQSVMIADLPVAVRGSGKMEVVRKIESLLDGKGPGVTIAANPASGDASAWLEKIAQQVNKGAIDTKLAADPAKTELYKGIQTVLARLGAYSKPATGAQKDTLDAVLAFQKANGLKADGVIGKGTWGKVREKFETAVVRR